MYCKGAKWLTPCVSQAVASSPKSTVTVEKLEKFAEAVVQRASKERGGEAQADIKNRVMLSESMTAAAADAVKRAKEANLIPKDAPISIKMAFASGKGKGKDKSGAKSDEDKDEGQDKGKDKDRLQLFASKNPVEGPPGRGSSSGSKGRASAEIALALAEKLSEVLEADGLEAVAECFIRDKDKLQVNSAEDWLASQSASASQAEVETATPSSASSEDSVRANSLLRMGEFNAIRQI